MKLIMYSVLYYVVMASMTTYSMDRVASIQERLYAALHAKDVDSVERILNEAAQRDYPIDQEQALKILHASIKEDEGFEVVERDPDSVELIQKLLHDFSARDCHSVWKNPEPINDYRPEKYRPVYESLAMLQATELAHDSNIPEDILIMAASPISSPSSDNNPIVSKPAVLRHRKPTRRDSFDDILISDTSCTRVSYQEYSETTPIKTAQTKPLVKPSILDTIVSFLLCMSSDRQA